MPEPSKKQRPQSAGFFASPLRYPGGKGRLGPWLASVIEHNGLTGCRYVEPYAGGAGAALYLLLKKHVGHIVINDADPLIHALWHSVVEQTDELVRLIESTPITMGTRETLLEAVQRPNRHSLLELGFAAFFLNRTSRSGILTGGVIGGKDQAGPYKLDARFQREDLVARVRAIGAMREHITVSKLDALDLLDGFSSGAPDCTLIYMDPPYYVKGSQLYLHHYRHADHVAIAKCASTVKHPLLITYDNCPEVRTLYSAMRGTEFSLQYSTHTARPVASEALFYANLELPSSPRLTRSEHLTARRTAPRSEDAKTQERKGEYV
ncbi:DNA adenine methylase [Methyloversatilis sp.]|uniref:DNA adenine methylase n=1 Tax=Methyloversatilis sp. TaxID=2569862 RepID=UPI003F715998